jgi:aminomethyltransferase
MTEIAALKKTALHDAHEKLGARLVEFGGWHMPVQYTGIVEEHRAVREAAGVFDISHMGEFFVADEVAGDEGKAFAFLQHLLTNDLGKVGVGQGQYTLMLNEAGGVIDDLIIYQLEKGRFFLVVNASMIDEDRAWVEKHLPRGVEFRDRSGDYAALAVQGPRAEACVQALLGAGWQAPARHTIAAASWNCQEVLVARTGYTGEDGFELFFANEIAEKLFLTLLEVGKPLGLKPCGLGARDTLRLEAGLPLNGNDLSAQRTPLAAGLGFFVSFDKSGNFIGKATVSSQKLVGLKEKLAAFRLVDKGPPPRPHYPVFQGAKQVGEVTSGAPSPTLGYGIGLAYVAAEAAAPGTRLELEVRGTRVPIEVVKKPFYKRAA